VICCSTDSQFSHLAWTNTPRKQGGLGEMKIPMLADTSLKVSRAYGVLNEDAGIDFRGLFIIDDKGRLRQITMNDLPVGRSVDEVLRLVQAFQYTDKHGEVCPAGWKPGAATIKSKSWVCGRSAGGDPRPTAIVGCAAKGTAASRVSLVSPGGSRPCPLRQAGRRWGSLCCLPTCPAGGGVHR
jgi:hypothetical protein